ncbi:MAG TPA: HEAT repeat domain-containing protein [Desulfuromonadaceae bacterium]|jgi:HEAT repeat protein
MSDDSVHQRITVLRPLLKDADPEVRSSAAAAIERLEGASALEEIMYSLKKGDTGAKIRAIYALGEIGGDKVVAPLVYCAGRPEAGIRAAAIEVLGRITSPAVLPVLIKHLGDSNGAIQARAIAALSNFPSSPELFENLRPFLEKQDGSLEAEAAIALAKLGDLDSLEQIIALLTSPHSSTRQAAAKALSLLPLQ